MMKVQIGRFGFLNFLVTDRGSHESAEAACDPRSWPKFL
jgi:hypothetical protein